MRHGDVILTLQSASRIDVRPDCGQHAADRLFSLPLTGTGM